VEHVIVAEDFTFPATLAMTDDVTGLGFPANDAVDALTFCSLGLGDQPRFRFGSGFAFDRLNVQALLGPAFHHLCLGLLEWVHAKLSQCDPGLEAGSKPGPRYCVISTARAGCQPAATEMMNADGFAGSRRQCERQ
jgi:hypothetical protein